MKMLTASPIVNSCTNEIDNIYFFADKISGIELKLAGFSSSKDYSIPILHLF